MAKPIDHKEYATAMRTKAVADAGVVRVSTELWEQIADIIENSVEVVRCKDCKHYNASANSCFNRQWDMESATEVPFVCASDFCSYGERKDNG